MGFTWKHRALWGGGLLLLTVGMVAGGGAPPRAQGQTTRNLGSEAACDGLEPAECCAQTLETASFRALEGHLPRRGELVVKLACDAASAPRGDKRLPKTACQSLLVARGWKVPEARSLCRPRRLAKRCRKHKGCKACVAAAGDLGYRGAAAACFALTHLRPERPRTGTRIEAVDASGSAVTVTRRRRVRR